MAGTALAGGADAPAGRPEPLGLLVGGDNPPGALVEVPLERLDGMEIDASSGDDEIPAGVDPAVSLLGAFRAGPSSPHPPVAGGTREAWQPSADAAWARRAEGRVRGTHVGLVQRPPCGQGLTVGRILVGTASWTDKTLLASGWYPDDADTPERRLQFYAAQFPLVEVDSTYYTPPNERNSQLWASRTPDGFVFDVKAYALLTQHPTRTTSLYKDLRPETDKRTVYLKDLDEAAVDEVWERFLGALAPLHDAGKLGSLLFQFPPWFSISRANKRYVLECMRRCAPYRMSVELRNATWLSDENRDETLDFLRSYAVPYVVVDMPQGYRSSTPPVVAATADLSVVRFHGHSDKWESKDIYERFGYLYSEQELREWAPRLEQLAEQVAGDVHVLTNNCYRDHAQVNARQLAQQLPAVPAPGVWPPA